MAHLLGMQTDSTPIPTLKVDAPVDEKADKEKVSLSSESFFNLLGFRSPLL